MNHKKIACLVSLMFSTSAMADIVLSPVVVTATRVQQNSFDLPVSIDVVQQENLDGQLGMTLSESLIRIPGITAQNRTQMAQDPQISTRGFGARSTFGVRGIRVYVDGIPMSTPDGIANPGNVDIGTLSSIEVMRGPFSSLYGSSSGGVINLITKEAPKNTEVGGGILGGSYGTDKEFGYATGTVDNVEYLVNYSKFSSDGYRDHSENSKDQATIKLKTTFANDTKVSVLFNWMDQTANDPGGLTAAEVAANPKQASGNNLSQNARVKRDNTQAGINIEHAINDSNTLNLITNVGNRSNLQYLYSAAFATQASVGNPNGRASAIDRDFWGADLRWTNKGNFLDKPYQLSAGLAYGSQNDHRTDDMANGGIMSVPPLGTPTKYQLRDEKNISYNFDQYIQGQWSVLSNVDLHAGVRHTDVTFKVEDNLVGVVDSTNATTLKLTSKFADGSGKISHQDTTPVVGAVWKINPTFNVYANVGKGFETPTFIEMAYTDTSGNGPNLGLKPSTSDNYEVGTKFFVGDNTRASISAFKIKTENEIVSASATSAYATYTNAGKTERNGVELSIDSALPNNFKVYGAYTYLDAQFKSAFNTSYTTNVTTTSHILAGNKISGTYKDQLYGELSWKYPQLGFSTAVEARLNSFVYANDTNLDKAAGYGVVNLRAAFDQKIDHWRLTEFVRVENIADKNYIGSVKNNDTSSRFYEPSAGRNWIAGVNASYSF